MIRKLGAAAVAVACAAGMAVSWGPLAGAESAPRAASAAASPAEARAVLPAHGTYKGVDHGGRIVTFTYTGNYMGHFAVNNLAIGGAHVGGSGWHETCHNGMCTKGTWVTDHHVQGMWRTRDGHWTSFSAYTQPASTIYPYVGAYMGRDHSGGFVHLMYRHGHLTDFKIRDTVYGDVPVHNNRFDACLARICVQGKWDDDNFIVGKWRHSNSSHWYSWEVHGYAH